MKKPLENLFAQVPADKFYPPFVDSEKQLCRSALVRRTSFGNAQVLCIEAQAGQGKSVFAAQYLRQQTTPFLWYQLGPEDADPVSLLTALLVGLKGGLAGFSAPLLEQMFLSGELSAKEVLVGAGALLEGLDRSVTGNFAIAFDDIHRLEEASASLGLLSCLIEKAPPHLRFVLLSRRQIPAPLTEGLARAEVQRVGNDDLRLNKTEIAQLLSDCLQVPASTAEVRQLYLATEGWLAGVLLAGHSLAGTVFHHTRLQPRPLDSLAKEGSIIDYFRSEVFAGLSEPLRRTLLKLALLDEIPLALAEGISEVPEIASVLRTLVQRNFFLRALDEKQTLFAFHHMFGEFLREQGLRFLEADERAGVLRQAGAFFARGRQYEKALGYLLEAGDFEAAEKLLRDIGMLLLASNRIITLKRYLDRIPEAFVQSHPWLSFYRGVAWMDIDPPKALPYLEGARASFAQRGEGLGEILAVAQVINFIIVFDGKYNLGGKLLPRAEELFEQLFEGLSPVLQIRIAQVLAGGNCFFRYDFDKTDHFAKTASDLAIGNDFEGHQAANCVIYCYRHAFKGDWPGYRASIEQAQRFLKSPRVGMVNKLGLCIAQMSYLALVGDWAGYRFRKELLTGSLDDRLISGSVVAPFLLIYDINQALAEGRFEQAQALAAKGLGSGGVAANPHQRSQYLHFIALTQALAGNKDEALKAAGQSRQLRLEVGEGRFDVLNCLVLGASYGFLGDDEKALELLEAAIGGSERIGEEYLKSAAHIHRAFIRLGQGQKDEAKPDLAIALATMKKNGYHYFFGWLPQVLEKVLAYAAAEGIEAEYAAMLAADRLGLALKPEGCGVPLLEIRTLGQFSMAIAAEQRVGEEDLTPAQREFLALLLSAPGRRLSQEQVQLQLWPDSRPEKSRAKFDTLLSRLRKTLGPLVKPHSAKKYLCLQKGILWLENCRVDADQFSDSGRRGLSLMQKGQVWQAGNALHRALDLWNGPYLANLAGGDEHTEVRRSELELIYLRCADRSGQMLAEAGRVPEAIGLVNKALALDPTNHALVRTLYGLHGKAKDPAAAGSLVKRYRQALQREEYLPQEVDEIIEALWESPE